ncbi:hypothetical protein GCM10020000_13770 [Streptomyces olivoverticillatus]
MVTEGSFPTTVFPLEPNAKAESIKLRTTNIGTPGTPVNAYSLLFAEPENKYIGAIAIPSVAGEIVRMPVAQETWLWDVAVTTAADGKTHTYWATGQKRTSNPVRPENGLYRRSPGQMAWERIEVLRGPDHKPCYIIADTEAVWLTTQNPNMVIRISLADMTVKNEELGTAAPEQLAFGKEGQVWVASSAGLHEFDARLSGPGSLQGLPHGGGAKGLCVGTNGELWYTNPTRKSLGCYTPPPPPVRRGHAQRPDPGGVARGHPGPDEGCRRASAGRGVRGQRQADSGYSADLPRRSAGSEVRRRSPGTRVAHRSARTGRSPRRGRRGRRGNSGAECRARLQ